MRYDHPQFTTIREALVTRYLGTTMAAANAVLVPSTFKTYYKAVVLGVSVKALAAGSGGGFSAIKVAKASSASSQTLKDTIFSLTVAAAALTSVNFTSPITIDGYAQGVHLYGSASAATDVAKLSGIVWRYRMLPNPTNSYPGANALG